MSWKTIYVFISSTFNDMHSERDYLIEKVFPPLKQWCAERQLYLLDVDLRWGITQEESLLNENLLKTCLRNIDKCIPFFICFAGQRRGFIPKDYEALFEKYPFLSEAYGLNSITELEILHATHHKNLNILAYRRGNEYLSELPHIEALRNVYTENVYGKPDPLRLPDTLIPFDYSAHWDTGGVTPELSLPLDSGLDHPDEAAVWRSAWIGMGLPLDGGAIKIPESLKTKAEEINAGLSSGRLTDFKVGDQALFEHIMEQICRRIEKLYPDQESPASFEGIFIAERLVNYIPPGETEKTLEEYINNPRNRIMVLSGKTGSGKSTVLANLTERNIKRNIFASFEQLPISEALLSNQIFGYFRPDGHLKYETMSDALSNLPQGSIVIIDGWEKHDPQFKCAWLNTRLPDGVAVIVSVSPEEERAIKLLDHLKGTEQTFVTELSGFTIGERKKFIRARLARQLKKIEPSLLKALINSKGAENPLYLSIVFTALMRQGRYEILSYLISRKLDGTLFSAINALIESLAVTEAPAFIDAMLAIYAAQRMPIPTTELSKILIYMDTGICESELSGRIEKLIRRAEPLFNSAAGMLQPPAKDVADYAAGKYGTECAEQAWFEYCLHEKTHYAVMSLFKHAKRSGNEGRASEIMATYSYLTARISAQRYADMTEDYREAGNFNPGCAILRGVLDKSSGMLSPNIRDIQNMVSLIGVEPDALLNEWETNEQIDSIRFRPVPIPKLERSGGVTLEYKYRGSTGSMESCISCERGEYYCLERKGSLTIRTREESYSFTIENKPVWRIRVNSSGSLAAVIYDDTELIVYKILRDASGMPMSMEAEHSDRGILNGNAGAAAFWAGETLIYQTRDGLYGLYGGEKRLLYEANGVLCGAAGESLDFAIFTNGSSAFCRVGTNITMVAVKAPVYALAYNKKCGYAVSLANGETVIYKNDIPLYTVKTGKPARAAEPLADGFILRDSNQWLTYIAPGEKPAALGAVPPELAGSAVMNASGDTVCFATNYNWCFATLGKGEETKLSVISGGKPRLLIKTGEGGYILDPYRQGGISLYERDCEGFVGNDAGEICRANQRFAQFHGAELPETIESNPEIRAVFSENAILSLCASRPVKGFYLFGEIGEVFRFEPGYSGLKQIGTIPEGYNIKSACSSGGRLLAGVWRPDTRRSTLLLYDIREDALELIKSIDVGGLLMAGDSYGGFYYADSGSLWRLSGDGGIKMISDISALSGYRPYTSMSAYKERVILSFGDGAVLITPESQEVVNTPWPITETALWGDEFIITLQSRAAYRIVNR